MYKNIKQLLNDLVEVSKYTKTTNKKKSIILLGIIGNLLVLSDILIILSFASFFDQKIEYDNFLISYFLENTYFLPFFILFRFFLIYFERISITKLQFRIEENFRIHLLTEVFNRGNVSVADAYYYVNTLSAQVGSFYSTLSSLFGSFIQILIFSTYLLFSNFQIIIIFLIGSLLLFIPTFYLTKLGRKYAHIAYESGNSISADLEKVLDNLFLIKIVNQIKNEIIKFHKNIDIYFSSRLSDIKFGTINTLLPNFFTLFGLSILLVFFNFGKFITFDFIGILIRLFQSLGLFNKNVHQVSTFHVYLEKLYFIEKNKEDINSNNFSYESNIDENIALEFNNVNFKYLGSEKLMFKNINLKIPRNKHTIITGVNGSGKSTLIGLMSGVFYPLSGNVNVYSKKFGYVSATPMILNSTLKENLLYGNEDEVSDDKIINYLTKFELFEKDSIYNLDQKISNKTLSMGQMQKVSFMRALLRDVDILVLDESTSNLDAKSKQFIYKILEKEDLTIINSTHNPNDLLNVDNHIKIKIVDDEGNREITLEEY